MPATHEVRVPDIGDVTGVAVVEVLVNPGDSVRREQALITLESDKAAMDVPSPRAGRVEGLHVAAGDKVSAGTLVATLVVEDSVAGDARDEVARNPATVATGPDDDTGAPSIAATGDGQHTGLVVIGAGPAGYSAAFRAADLGLDVTLVERHVQLGGVCLNVGCIPSKALLHAARVVEQTREMAHHGIRFGAPEIDTGRLRAWKDEVIGTLAGGLDDLARRRGVRRIQGRAAFIDAHHLTVEHDEGVTRLAFDQAIVATGSRAVRLRDLPDDPRIMYSRTALELEALPERLLIVGGGVIGMEMASLYAGLGSGVTVAEWADQLLPEADTALVKPLLAHVRRRYDAVYLGTRVAGVEPHDHGLEVRFEGGGAPDPQTFDRVLIAVGRRPNTQALGLEAAGIDTDANGVIRVNRQCRTSQDHIFAAGDAVHGPMLAHKAAHEAKVAAEVAAGQPSVFEPRAVPVVAYCDPEVAWTGLTEHEARSESVDVQVSTFPWAASGRALGLARSEGVTRLLFEPSSGRLVGGGAVGPHAGDLVAEMGLAIEMGADAEDVGLTIHPHPTLSETVAFAAEAFAGTVTDLYVPGRRRRQASGG